MQPDPPRCLTIPYVAHHSGITSKLHLPTSRLGRLTTAIIADVVRSVDDERGQRYSEPIHRNSDGCLDAGLRSSLYRKRIGDGRPLQRPSREQRSEQLKMRAQLAHVDAKVKGGIVCRFHRPNLAVSAAVETPLEPRDPDDDNENCAKNVWDALARILGCANVR